MKITFDEQLCFPLYALSRKIIALYQPLLKDLDLTYPQYQVMMLLWEKGELSVKELGEKLMLDSGTLSPLLKRLESKKLVTRQRSTADERTVIICLTEGGKQMQQQAQDIPQQLLCVMKMTETDLVDVRNQLNQLLAQVSHLE